VHFTIFAVIVFVNIVTVNGSTCATISSAHMTQKEVNQVAINIRKILLEGVDGASKTA